MITIEKAKQLIENLKEEEFSFGRNSDTWYMYENHVFGAAKVASTLADALHMPNVSEIYVSALLHDISRTEESRKGRFHGILGYEKLISLDEKAARTALLHMFLFHQLPPFERCHKMFFDHREDYDFIADYLSDTILTEEDLVIQLADNLANKNGLVTIEERAEEYAERHHVVVDELLIEPVYRLKRHFDRRLGQDVYDVLGITPSVSK